MANQAMDLAALYQKTRLQTGNLCKHLGAEDMVAQSMPDASPTKWHLAHTTWFFETFILREFSRSYSLFDEHFPHLFNSYYESAGSRYYRPQRGLLTRPSLNSVLDYRKSVDDAMLALLDLGSESVRDLVTVGLHHEMQHQELMLTDILHLLSHNPMNPAVFAPSKPVAVASGMSDVDMVARDGALIHVGGNKDEFNYDCELPRHLTYIGPHKLGRRLVTNRDWLQFINDKGYEQPLLWLSEGWARCQQDAWEAPLYWQLHDGEWFQYGLDGLQPINLDAPVCHVSYYEADAFARWAGKRLPREHELEHCVEGMPIEGNFVEHEHWRPQPVSESRLADTSGQVGGVTQLYGDVWEWTQSAFSPYPNFKAEQGALGEYNGKFMVNQFVLKGGSCATPTLQMRPSYRNFFYPHHRWQFSGLRLAEDL